MVKRYLTTPIYYVNAEPHIGHAYTNLATDSLARFYRAMGDEVFFLTGTDEHGEKVGRTATEEDKKPQEFVDEVVKTFRQLWQDLKLSHDGFIRTTDEQHVEAVQHVFQQLYDQGDIYLDTYEGPYCVHCETYWSENKLDDQGNCPECHRQVEYISEDSYFFRLTKYLPDLHDHLQANPEFVRPESRYNEVVSLLDEGVQDLSVSRTKFDWGITVPFDEDHVVYVWFDALLNYLSGIGYPQPKFNKWWPPEVQFIGKDILRFHAVIWPCMLMALGVKLPKRIQAHGWWTLEGDKISKSKGNVVDPRELANQFGRDALRYFLLRRIPFGEDGVMSDEGLIELINGDLANNLGNLVNRSLSLVEKFAGGVIPEPAELGNNLQKPGDFAAQHRQRYIELMKDVKFDRALKEVMLFASKTNRWLQEEAPWKLDREQDKEQIEAILYQLCEALNEIAYLIEPVMPETANEIRSRLDVDQEDNLKTRRWGELNGGEKVTRGEPLFPRIDEA